MEPNQPMQSMQQPPSTPKKSGLGIIILIILALVIVGIVLGMQDNTPSVPEVQDSSTQTGTSAATNDDLYTDIDSMDKDLNSVEFEGSADTL